MKKGLTITLVNQFCKEQNLSTCEDLLNNIRPIYNHLLSNPDCGLGTMCYEDFEKKVHEGYQKAVFQQQLEAQQEAMFQRMRQDGRQFTNVSQNQPS